MKNFLLYFLIIHALFWSLTALGYLVFSFIEWEWLPFMSGKDFRTWELAIVVMSVLTWGFFKD